MPSAFYGVVTTRIFCRTGCPSRRPNPENVLYFSDINEPKKIGFRACKRCRPDLPSPALEEFQRQMTEDFVQLAISSPEKTIRQLAEELAVSRRQLERITVIVSGLTPRKLARREQSKL